MGEDPHEYCGLHFHPKTQVPQRIFTSLPVRPREQSAPPRTGGPSSHCSLPGDLDAGILRAGLLGAWGRPLGRLAEVHHVQVGVGEVVVAVGRLVGLDAGVLRLLAHLHHPPDGLPLLVEVQVRVGQVVGVGFLCEAPKVPPLGQCPCTPQPSSGVNPTAVQPGVPQPCLYGGIMPAATTLQPCSTPCYSFKS